MNLIKSLLFVLFLGLSAISFATTPVDVNQADAPALAEGLNGVGPKIAAAIVSYRKQHGPFRRLEDLLNVKGIGPRILERNRANIMVGRSGKKKAAP
jgi:competence protein ComEA